MWSSNHFLYAAVSHIFQGPDFSRSRFFRVRVFQGPSFSGSSFFRVQVSQGLGCSGSSFFKVWVQGLGLRCWPLNFILHKAFYKTKRGLELVVLVLNFIKWLNFLAWLPSLLDILGKKCAISILFPRSDVTDFEINLNFLIKLFSCMAKLPGKKLKYLQNKKCLK